MSNSDKIQLLALLIQFLSVLAIFIVFIAQVRMEKKVRKREIYQRLELAAIDLFRFEISNSEICWILYAHDRQFPKVDTKEYRELTNHITQILNLFEMIVEFRNEKIVELKIFSTWIAWFWELSQLKNFVLIWNEIKTHYTKDLQFIIEAAFESNESWNSYVETLNLKYRCEHIAKLKTVNVFTNSILVNTLELDFFWATKNNINNIDDIIYFFVKNINRDYVSNGEIIGGRADFHGEWKFNISEIMHREFEKILNNDIDKTEYKKLAICGYKNEIVAIAITEFNKTNEISYLSDIIVAKNFRRKNIGEIFMQWIENEIRQTNIKAILLESGINNYGAHNFFTKLGYSKFTIGMIKQIFTH